MVGNHQTVRLLVGAVASGSLGVPGEHANVVRPSRSESGQGVVVVGGCDGGGVEAREVDEVVGFHLVFGDGGAAVRLGQAAAHHHGAVVGKRHEARAGNVVPGDARPLPGDGHGAHLQPGHGGYGVRLAGDLQSRSQGRRAAQSGRAQASGVDGKHAEEVDLSSGQVGHGVGGVQSGVQVHVALVG